MPTTFFVTLCSLLDRPRVIAILMFFGVVGLAVGLRRDPKLARRVAAAFAAMVAAFALGHLKFRTERGYLIDLTGVGLWAMAVIVAVVGAYLFVWVLPPGIWLRARLARRPPGGSNPS